MRDRLGTPFFPVPRGKVSSGLGPQSPPGRTIPARALEGQVVGNGRYVLRQKTSHRADAVRFAAHDLVGEIDVTLDLHPDVQEDSGFRLGQPEAVGPQGDLPNLYGAELSAEMRSRPGQPVSGATRGLALRVWRALRSALRSRASR